MTRNSKEITLNGIHIQWPWSRLLLSGKKTIETRSYPIPAKYVGLPLAIVETPGPHGKKHGIEKAMIIGIITFDRCKKYLTKKNWKIDFDKHCVRDADPLYAFDDNKEKWGWNVSSVEALQIPQKPPKKRGIVFISNCKILL